MPALTIISLILSFIDLPAAKSGQIFGVADHYGLWLSDTSVSVRPDRGGWVAMQFPSTRREISAGGLRVDYPNVFPKIDLAVYRHGRSFEYDWKAGPGADASAICVTFRGARSVRLSPSGDLILITDRGEVRHGRPFAYQVVDGTRRAVAARFDLAGGGQVRFRLGAYDKSRPWLSTRRFRSSAESEAAGKR